MSIWKKLSKTDWYITLVTIALLAIGTSVVYSTTIFDGDFAVDQTLLPKHLILLTIGLIFYLLISILDISWLKEPTVIFILYILIIGLLLYVNLFAPSIAGTNRWIDLGFIAIQPSEFAKIVIIITTSFIFSRKKLFQNEEKGTDTIANTQRSIFSKMITQIPERHYYKKLLITFLLLIPILILTFIQPALGNTIIIFGIWFFLAFSFFPYQKEFITYIALTLILSLILFQFISVGLSNNGIMVSFHRPVDSILFTTILSISFFIIWYLSKISWKIIVLIPIVIIAGVSMMYFTWNNVIGDYQRTRIETYVLGPESDPQGAGYQVNQSIIAIGSGRLYGRGYLEGTQSSLHILTQAHTDFAFAAFSEQFGLIGSVIILLLFSILLFRIYLASTNSHEVFTKALAIGITAMLTIHIFVNIGMNLGALPVTGIPLPLISYGGSSVLVILISLGLIQSINTSKKAVDISNSLMLRSLESNI